MPGIAVPRPPGYKKPKTYVVRQGDTLEKIASQFGLTDTQLIGSNRGVGQLSPGVVLSIPEPPGLKPTTPTTRSYQNIGRAPIGQGATTNIFNTIGRGFQTWWAGNPLQMTAMQPNIVNQGWAARANMMPSTDFVLGNLSPNPITAAQNYHWGASNAAGQTIGGLPPDMRGENATTPGVSTGGNYTENLPYGKSYNYAVNTGEIPNPGSAAAVKYGDDATYNLARAMVDGYGYDYGNYLNWASENNIQRPASYYSWKSTQGVTRSGQSSQFWEYMQGLQAGQQSSSRRGTTIKMLSYKEAKEDNPGLTYREWLMRQGGKLRRAIAQYPQATEETIGTPAIQAQYTNSSNGRYYSAPASFGLVSWRM